MIWRRNPPSRWTDFGFVSVCDYRGISVVVHVCGGPEAWAWRTYRRQTLFDFEIESLSYFGVHDTNYAISRDEAKADALREIDRFLDRKESSRCGAPA